MANPKKALVIGINNYPMAPLKGAINDALEVARLLVKNGDRDETTNFDVKLERDIPSQAELYNLISDFFKFQSHVAVLYFAGHGFLNELGGVIVTPDFQPGNEGISMDRILGIANVSPCINKIIILDCCNSGVFASPSVGGSVTPINTGITVLAACRDDEPAREINGHGVFTNLLLQALRGGAADITGHISPGSIYAYIDQALGAHQQRPVFKTNVSEFVSLRHVSPHVTIKTLRKLVDYFPYPGFEKPLNPSFEETNNAEIKHEIIQPYSDPENVAVFKDLQKYTSASLVTPIGEEHMYFAAMYSKACALTPLGYHYWRLVKDGII